MKATYFIICLSLLFTCQSKPDNSAQETFDKNSQVVMANIQGFANGNVDYSQYADDFVMLDTGFGATKDSISLDEMKEFDKQMFENFDFKLLTNPPVLLPGVNPVTKQADGSVRHYSSWEVSIPATDSSDTKSGIIKLYESFDFNAEGKILIQQVYGDFTGLMMHLNPPSKETVD